MSAHVAVHLTNVDKSKAVFKSESTRELPPRSYVDEGRSVPMVQVTVDATLWADAGRPTTIRVEVEP